LLSFFYWISCSATALVKRGEQDESAKNLCDQIPILQFEEKKIAFISLILFLYGQGLLFTANVAQRPRSFAQTSKRVYFPK